MRKRNTLTDVKHGAPTGKDKFTGSEEYFVFAVSLLKGIVCAGYGADDAFFYKNKSAACRKEISCCSHAGNPVENENYGVPGE